MGRRILCGGRFLGRGRLGSEAVGGGEVTQVEKLAMTWVAPLQQRGLRTRNALLGLACERSWSVPRREVYDSAGEQLIAQSLGRETQREFTINLIRSSSLSIRYYERAMYHYLTCKISHRQVNTLQLPAVTEKQSEISQSHVLQ